MGTMNKAQSAPVNHYITASVRMPREFHARCKEEADKRDRSLSYFLLSLLKKEIGASQAQKSECLDTGKDNTVTA